MKLIKNHYLYLRLLALTLLFSGQSCQSSGQNNQDESDWSFRRNIPEYIIEELPSEPDTLSQSSHFLFFKYGNIKTILLDEVIDKSELAVDKLELLTGKKLKPGTIKWYLYPSSETKGLMLKNSTPCQIDFDNQEIHLVVNEVFADYYLGQANELILNNLLGIPKVKVLQAGFAIYFSENWQKQGYQFWTGKLLVGNQLPSLKDLFDDQKWKYSSDLIFGSAAASFCSFLINYWGQQQFLDKYLNWDAPFSDLSDLELLWRDYISQSSIEEYPVDTPNLPYLKGFNFAHEGYRIYNGYGSRKAAQSLSYIKNMHANAVAIVPYSFTRHPKEATPIPVAKRTGSENDESVIQSSENAQALGLSVILKPQIWVGRGMWTGDIDMHSDDDWLLFFKHYGHWISHYAMLSEIYDWEVLCIGTELVQTTLKNEMAWRKLIQSTRTIYSGLVTYAANWGEEFENIKIWDALDFIGLNCYYPLSTKDNPSDRELDKGFSEVIKKVEKVYDKYHKPILFTEIGFPCIEAPWKEPHRDWGDFKVNGDHQKRCYEVVFEGIKNKPWCGGILWWKFPSDINTTHTRNTGFSPSGKPAEEVITKWFQMDE